jgi:hypothetical protein
LAAGAKRSAVTQSTIKTVQINTSQVTPSYRHQMTAR